MSDDQTIGRYRIVERVGRGPMGILYRGADPVLGREVAIKVMSADFAADGDQDARKRFFREARAAAKLQHRNIVTIFEFAEEGGTPYIVMEFLRGRSLAARMREAQPPGVDEILDVIGQLCTGLHFAHEHGIVHRDVKPDNVWLLDDGTVKLLDFGIAKLSSSTFTRPGDLLGSAAYVAPEQLAGGPVDARADVFAATVVLYELLAGRKPFDVESLAADSLKAFREPPTPLESLARDLPAPLFAAVARGLRKAPGDRYQTAAELGADLQFIRGSLASSGDTVVMEAPSTEEWMDAPSPAPARAGPHGGRDAAVRETRGEAPAEPPADEAAPSRRPGLWIAGLVAILVLLAGVAWFGV